VTGTPASAPAVRITDRQLERLLVELNHPLFTVRTQATEQLCTLDDSFLPRLAERYRAANSDEMRHRIGYVMETIFYHTYVAGRGGFLGMKIVKLTLDDLTDPATGLKTRGAYIPEVLEGLPAARAGLQSGDTIVALNNRPLPDEPSTDKLIGMIGRMTPGSPVALRVLRPGETPRHVLVSGKGDSSQMLGLTFVPAISGVSSGVIVTAVAANSPAEAAGLKPYEVIIDAGGVSLTSSAGPQLLKEILQATGPNAAVNLTVLKLEEVTIHATVGMRPLERMDDADRAQFHARFARWWREQGGKPLPLPEQDPYPLYGNAPQPPPSSDVNSILP
jgi:hypothetical protein